MFIFGRDIGQKYLIVECWLLLDWLDISPIPHIEAGGDAG
jgi:hypothetical protein